MCIAIIKRQGISMPDEETLYNCFKNNPHGAGFSFSRNGYNYIRKGFMDFESFLDALSIARIQVEESAVIHFRVASVGKIFKGNCHPFPAVQNIAQLRSTDLKTDKDVIVHNGTFYSFQDYENEANSDTMKFVNTIAPLLAAKSFMNKKQIKSLYEVIDNIVVENSSRIAIMNNNGKINFFGDWIFHKKTGILYSNNSFIKVSERFSNEQLVFNF